MRSLVKTTKTVVAQCAHCINTVRQVKDDIEKTQFWPHSQTGSEYRAKGIGENIAWDFSPIGSPCSESVYRWYAEYFYFDETSPMKGRRGAEPVGKFRHTWSKHTRCNQADCI